MIHFSPNGGDLLQDTKERHGSAPLAWLFRAVLLLLAAVVAAGALTPKAWAAGTEDTRCVIPLGQAVGIKLFAQGVLVVGLSDISTDQGLASPAKACGLQEGDVITHINDEKVSSIEEVQTILQDSNGQELELSVLRDQACLEVTTRAAQCSADGAYKLGAWIRDSMAGIGTLTFVEPATGLFGTLGHGINDVDTAELMKLQSGAITPASVSNIVKGMDGRPGSFGGLLPPARTWELSLPTQNAGSLAISMIPSLSPARPFPWPRPSRSTRAAPPFWLILWAAPWRNIPWRSRRSAATPRTPGTWC